MNTRLSEGNFVRTWKRILGLAGLASLSLVCAGSALAQAQPVQSDSTAARPAATAGATLSSVQSFSVTPAAKQEVLHDTPAKRFTPKGQHEGITVHGHWIIEVRDPNGKLVTRREFENSLQDHSALPALLAGQAVAGAWWISLYDPAAVTGSPCNGGQCIVLQSGASYGTPPPCVGPPVPACSNNLTLSYANNGGLVLSGSVQANQAGNVGTVSTNLTYCELPITPTAPPLNPASPTQCAANNLPTGETLTAAHPFTAATPQSPVNNVQPNQTISVIVQFSFQ